MKDDVRVLSFECFGTLIDPVQGCQQALEEEGITEMLPEPFEKFLPRFEARVLHWQATSYRHFREVLALSLQDSLKELEVKVDDRLALRFADSLPRWPAYPDTTSALRRLGSHWPLCVITNVDRDPIREALDRLGIPFAEVVSGEDVRAYKPAAEHFQELKNRLGERASGLVHVATTLSTDVRPALELGMKSVWVNRRGLATPKELGVEFHCKDLVALATKLGV